MEKDMHEEELRADTLQERMIIRLPRTVKAPRKGEDFVVISVMFENGRPKVELRDKRAKVITKKLRASRLMLCWFWGDQPYICPHQHAEDCNCIIYYT